MQLTKDWKIEIIVRDDLASLFFLLISISSFDIIKIKMFTYGSKHVVENFPQLKSKENNIYKTAVAIFKAELGYKTCFVHHSE